MIICLIIMWSAGSIQFTIALGKSTNVAIVLGASSPSSRIFFNPNFTSINVGDIVTWRNDDVSIHTVTSGTFNTGKAGPIPFDSGIINSGGVFTHQFNAVNTYDYYCRIHPFMTGKIIVNT